MHPAELDITELLKDCVFSTTRRQGPGGQHRNKVETAVVVKHVPSGIQAEANEKRSQEANRKEAIFRLRIELAIKIRTTRIKEMTPLFQKRTTGGKFSLSPRHSDFPAVLSELLDRLEQREYSIPETAEITAVTGSQILKFLRLCPPAFEYFNRQRAERNLHRIKF